MAGLLVARPSSKTRQEVKYNNDNNNDNNNNTGNNIKVDKHSVIRAEPQFPDRPAFDLVAIVDPVSQGGQVLLVLQQVLNARVRLFMNCVDKQSEMPNKSYFRLLLPWPSVPVQCSSTCRSCQYSSCT